MAVHVYVVSVGCDGKGPATQYRILLFAAPLSTVDPEHVWIIEALRLIHNMTQQLMLMQLFICKIYIRSPCACHAYVLTAAFASYYEPAFSLS